MGKDTGVIVGLIIVFGAAIVIQIYYAAKRAKFRREARYSLSANAIVIAKRSQIEVGHNTSYTYNFVTFEIEGLGRIEFNVDNAIGLLVEGDRGTLRYLTDPYRFVNFNITERSPKFQ